jgi:16S rRNA (cytidine1402-2'-O)-methyltransferase
MTLFLVSTPIGNLEDITHRALRVLSEVDVIAAEDTRTVKKLLTHYEIPAPRLVSLFEGNEASRIPGLLAALSEGQSIAVVSEAGTPAVSDPGQRLVREAGALGIRVEAIPGASAVLAALVSSGLTTGSFSFFGFPPRAEGARRQQFGGLRSHQPTLVFFESPERLVKTLADLGEALGDDREVAVGRELTKMHEEVRRGTLAEVRQHFEQAGVRGECTLVVEGAAIEAADTEIDLDAAVVELLDQGLGPKDVAARLVARTGKPRRVLYQLALSLKRQRD